MQKIIQIGNSTGIIIPKSLLQKVGLKIGTQIMVEKNADDNSLVISTSGKKT